jgi:hypothetical protein
MERKQAAQRGGNSAYFRRLTIGSGRCIVAEGAQVKLTSNRRKIFGRVEYFEIPGGLPADDKKYYGSRALVHFTRIPTAIYGEGRETEKLPISAMDLSSNNSHLVKKDELDALVLDMPSKMRFQLYETQSARHEKFDESDLIEFKCGIKYYGFGVQLVNSKGNLVTCQPQSVRKFSVRVQVFDEDSRVPRDFGSSPQLWEWSPTEKKFKDTSKVSKDQTVLSRQFYGFWYLTFKKAGTFPMVVEAFDAEGRLVLKKEIKIKVWYGIV